MNELLKEAITLYNQGNKLQAAKLLVKIIQEDPNNSEAWYGLALSVDAHDRKIYCLEKVLSLDPSHQKAQKLLAKLQSEKDLPPANVINTEEGLPERSRQKSTSDEKKILFVLTGVVLLLVICIFIIGFASWTKQGQARNIQATATAQYLQCSKQFENELTRLLSQFFRQQSIADVTARINLPEQISRLEEIRTEAWNMSEKSCQQNTHSYLMNYMDEAIASYVAFSGKDEVLSTTKYIDSLIALSDLDDEVIRAFDKGGLINLFRGKGYFYWEGLDNPNWKNELDG